MNRRPGLSKGNERKLRIAKKLLAQVSQDLDQLDRRHLFDLAVAVAKAHDATSAALAELDRQQRTREFAVSFYRGAELLDSYGTSGLDLSVAQVLTRANEYRRSPRGKFNEPAPDLTDAKLVVSEHFRHMRSVVFHLDERKAAK
jgi:hypothetical protein